MKSKTVSFFSSMTFIFPFLFIFVIHSKDSLFINKNNIFSRKEDFFVPVRWIFETNIFRFVWFVVGIWMICFCNFSDLNTKYLKTINIDYNYFGIFSTKCPFVRKHMCHLNCRSKLVISWHRFSFFKIFIYIW